MILMVLEKVPQSLRGELTRWLLEIKTGIYVGHVNGMVSERLWDKCSKSREAGSVFQAWSTNTEQHFKMRHERRKWAGNSRLGRVAIDARDERRIDEVQKWRIMKRAGKFIVNEVSPHAWG